MRLTSIKTALCFAALSATGATQATDDHIGTIDSWTKSGKEFIANKIATKPNTNRAKNVILFVGDGMSVATVTAAGILEGQLKGGPGEGNLLSFEQFPYAGLVKTYNVDAQVSDSAGTASAMNTGVKTRMGVINTSPKLPHSECSLDPAMRAIPLAEKAEKLGMSTGIVSTTRLTHATPAAVYGYSAARGWESDTDTPADKLSAGCGDLASQMLGNIGGNGLEVALGGGRRNFYSKPDGGRREDGRDLRDEWLKNNKNAAYVSNASELAAVDLNKTEHLMGLFAESDMAFEAFRKDDEPHIADMTETAIKMLETNENGYYLMVEAARIDHAHHGSNAYRALHDTVALSDAVKRAVSMVDLSETLIIVTADHSHTLTIAGYPSRGNPIFGLVQWKDEKGEIETELGSDEKPYTTLGYINGPGAVAGERDNLTQEQVLDPDHRQQGVVPKGSETHAGDDVAIYAVGPWSHLATGTMEQSIVYHIMAHALGIDERLKK